MEFHLLTVSFCMVCVFMCCCQLVCVYVGGQVEKPAAGLKGKQEHRFAELDCVQVATPHTRCGISAPV